MGQCEDHGEGVIEQECKRLGDQTNLDQPGIDDAVVAQDNLPGEDPQQVAGPEGHGDENQPDQLVFGYPEGDEIGHGIGQQYRYQCHRTGYQHGFTQQV